MKKGLTRITVDLPLELNEKVDILSAKADLSKAQYTRMALQVMNTLTENHKNKVIIKTETTEYQLLIPGIAQVVE